MEDFRVWVEQNCPKEIRGKSLNYAGGTKHKIPGPAFEQWFNACVERGLTVPEWSPDYGGAGLNKVDAAAFREAMHEVSAPIPLFGLGIAMLGPTIIEFGTEDQKRRHLPRIARGEVCWCQGYSEPGAGSDLASLRTRDDSPARDNVLRIEMDDAAFQLTKERARQESIGSGTATFATSTFKFLSSELESRRLDAITAMAGTRGIGWSGDTFEADELTTTRRWLLSKGFLIAGGSSEVQRNIVAKRVLGLPD